MTFEMTINNITYVKDDLGSETWDYIKQQLHDVKNNGNLVSVQLKTIQDGEFSDYVILYGIYEKTIEEDNTYMSSGGLWVYSDPSLLLTAMM
jgi:hypothetical protein